jgi:transcriptional regulator with XRE-family HTH domain
MNKVRFGEFIRKIREEKNLPLRKVAAFLDIDTSTLSKVEREERPISIEYLKPLCEILNLDLKEIQIKFIKDRITKDFSQLEYLSDGLKAAMKDLNDSK